MMQISAMTEKIEIQRLSSTIDERGNPLTTWTTEYTCRAEISSTNNTDIYVRHDSKSRSYGYDDPEYYAARLELHEIKIKFIIRYTKHLANIDTTKYRLVWNGDIFNLLSATNMRAKKTAKNEKIVLVAVCKDGNNTLTEDEDTAADSEGGEDNGE